MKKLLDRIEAEIHEQMSNPKEQTEMEVEEFTRMTDNRELAIYKALIAAQLIEDTIARA